MTRALLDTDILSELMKQKDLRVAERARAYLATNGSFRRTKSCRSAVKQRYSRDGSTLSSRREDDGSTSVT
jgi:hypothetical protein